MPITHVVKQGECLSAIARSYGFADDQKVYEHPDNAELRQKRPNPNVLFPGDEVVIPERAAKTLNLSTGKTHRLVIKTPPRHLRLALKDAEGNALANQPYTLTVNREVLEGTTDGEGFLEHKLASNASSAELECGEQRWDLALGHLNPMEDVPQDDVSGVEARLINLGYALEPTGQMNLELRSAIRAFQHQNGLDVTGHLDSKTLSKLKDVHGS